MKFAILLIFLMAFGGCSKGPGTNATLSVSKSFVIGAQAGGLLLTIKNISKSTTTTYSLVDTTYKISLEHGEYEFKVSGWEGIEPIDGTLKCGSLTANLKDPTAQIEIPITEANCNNSNFSASAVRLVSCMNLTAVTGPGIYCDSSARGSIASYRIRLPASNGTLSSNCIMASSFPTSVTDNGIHLPGNIPTLIDTFTSDDCSTGKVTENFYQGLAIPITGTASYLYGGARDVYFKDTPITVSLNTVSIISTNSKPEWAMINDTVKVLFSSMTPLAAVTGTIQNGTAIFTDLGFNLGLYNYALERVMTASDVDGTVNFNILINGQSFYTTTDMTYVMVDKGTSGPNATLINPLSSPGIISNPTFNITALEPNASVSMYQDPSCSSLVMNSPSSGGMATINVPALSPGMYSFYLRQTDLAGNVSICAGPVMYQYMPLALTSVHIQSNNFTNNQAKAGDTITLTFTSSAQTAFNVYISAMPATVVNSGLNYTATYTLTGAEPNGIASFVISANGQTFNATTDSSQVTIDTIAPPLPTIAILGNSPLYSFNPAPTFNLGNLEPGNTVKIYNDSNCTVLNVQTTAASATASLAVTPLTLGNHTFYAKQYDMAGNPSPCTSGVNFRLKKPFVSRWQVNAGDTITLPLPSGAYVYDFNVDWGDGSPSETHSAYGVYTHQYLTAGTFTMTIRGKVEAWSFNGSASATKITEVNDFGELDWKVLQAAFKGCTNLTIFNGGDFSQVTDMGSMFTGATLVTPNTSTWNTTNVTDMSSMFNMATQAQPDTSAWNTSNVTHMGSMFEGASMANPNTSNWNTSAVAYMYNMFKDTNLANPDVSGWDTSAVQQMDGMFKNAIAATPNVTSWDTSSVEYMTNMFYGATNSNPNTENWNLGSATQMDEMFEGSAISKANWSKFIVMAETEALAARGPSGVTQSLAVPHDGSAVSPKNYLEGSRAWSMPNSNYEP